MNSADSEGLGLSVLVYLSAVLGVLALLLVPAYYATRAEVHQNPVLAQSNPLLHGTAISERVASGFPLERLQRQNLADAETVAALKPKTAAKTTKKSEQRVAARPAKRDNGTPMAELQNQPDRISASPFSLF